MASSYKVNVAKEIPNITENYINSHLFTFNFWYLQCLFKYSHIFGMFFDWPVCLYSEWLGADWNMLGKLGMKLASYYPVANELVPRTITHKELTHSQIDHFSNDISNVQT